jgi:endo-1,3-1,4-beta-glycanase ExoK
MIHVSRLVATASLTASLALAATSAYPLSERDSEGFLDQFESLDRDRWYISSGWANGPHQSCLWHEDRVEVEQNILRLELSTDPRGDRDLSCAEIQSNEWFGHGTYEARMKVPFAPGANANFFTYIGETQDRPHHEIDFEFISPQEPMLQTNFFIDGTGEREEFVPAIGADEDFRTYSFVWEPDALRWFVDGELIREEIGTELPTEDQKIYLSIWSTDLLVDWMGLFEPTDAPMVLEVDWVSFTPHGTECMFDESVLCTQEWIEASGR